MIHHLSLDVSPCSARPGVLTEHPAAISAGQHWAQGNEVVTVGDIDRNTSRGPRGSRGSAAR